MGTRIAAFILAFAAVVLAALIGIVSAPPPVHAQGGLCNQSVAVTAAGGSTTIVVASQQSTTIYVCGFLLTGDTAATAVQFLSSGTALTGVMLTPANGPLAYGDGTAIVIRGIANANLAVSAATGSVRGVITFGQQ